MSDLICITNRKLCSNNFLDQIEMIASAHPKAIVLREKDLSEKEYEQLARQVMQICQKHGTQCILHSFSNVATTLGATAVHMPLPLLQKMTPQEKSHFQIIGASCHSLEEAKEAQNLGCTYITAGHIFLTDCKKGLPGRGLPFLEEICKAVRIPVYLLSWSPIPVETPADTFVAAIFTIPFRNVSLSLEETVIPTNGRKIR